MGRLKNKVAIVTGGSQGIGATTVEMFVREGAKVVIADINEKAGRELEKKINKDGVKALFYKLDVTNYKNWEDTVKFTQENFGNLNILINNAGISYRKNISETTIQEWDTSIAVLQTGVFYGMQVCIEAMKEHGEKCSIVNTSSIEGLVAEAEFFAYCGAKGAVTLMTKSAAIHCGQERLPIRVNSVHPGYIMTPMAYDDAKQNNQTIEEYSAEFIKKHPIGYLGEPEDIAYGYLYLASDEANFVTGSSLVIDGAYTAQ